MNSPFRYITDSGLENLKNFKYIGGDYTALDLLLNPWWIFAASLFPRWISPNMITLIGTQGVIIAWTLVYYEYLTLGNVSPAVFFFAFVMQFVYQTMDAADGKHARNTGQSTPLGALFDHGCDGVTTICLGLMVEVCVTRTPHLGRGYYAAFGMMLPLISFFCAQWQFLHTRRLDHQGVTEAQISAMICGLVAGISLLKNVDCFGYDVAQLLPSVWPSVVQILGPKWAVVTVGDLCLGGSGLMGTKITLESAYRVAVAKGFRPFISLLPFIGYFVASVVLFTGHYADFEVSVRLMIASGFLVFLVQMIISGLCCVDFPLVHLWSVPFFVIAGLGYAQALQWPAETMAACSLWQLFCFLCVSGDTIYRICNFLDVPFLRAIPLKKD